MDSPPLIIQSALNTFFEARHPVVLYDRTTPTAKLFLPTKLYIEPGMVTREDTGVFIKIPNGYDATVSGTHHWFDRGIVVSEYQIDSSDSIHSIFVHIGNFSTQPHLLKAGTHIANLTPDVDIFNPINFHSRKDCHNFKISPFIPTPHEISNALPSINPSLFKKIKPLKI